MVVRPEREQHVAHAQAVDEAGQFGDGRLGRARGCDLDSAGRERVALRVDRPHGLVVYEARRRLEAPDRDARAEPDRADDLDARRGVLCEVVVERLDAVAPADHDRAVQAAPAQDERLLHGPDRQPRRADAAHDRERVRRDGRAGRARREAVQVVAEKEHEHAEDGQLAQRDELVEAAAGVALGVEAREGEQHDPAGDDERAHERRRVVGAGRADPAQADARDLEQRRRGAQREGVAQEEGQQFGASRHREPSGESVAEEVSALRGRGDGEGRRTGARRQGASRCRVASASPLPPCALRCLVLCVSRLAVLALAFISAGAAAQSHRLLPLGDPAYTLVERLAAARPPARPQPDRAALRRGGRRARARRPRPSLARPRRRGRTAWRGACAPPRRARAWSRSRPEPARARPTTSASTRRAGPTRPTRT